MQYLYKLYNTKLKKILLIKYFFLNFTKILPKVINPQQKNIQPNTKKIWHIFSQVSKILQQ